jgi:hypothetical protein
MEISVVRKRLSETIDRAKRQAAERRGRSDQAAREFEVFLQKIAVPLFRQVANALKAEGYPFTVFTPSGSVRLMSDRSSSDYVELTLDTAQNPPCVIGEVRRERGRQVLDTEHTIGTPDTLTEEQLLDFLLRELEAFVGR